MSFKNQKKSTVKKLVIELGEGKNSRFAQEDLINTLEKIPFELININLSTKKEYIGISGTGYSSIGFINSFNKEDKTFDVVIFENRVQAIEKLSDIVIIARAFTDRENNITKIIGLDIEPVEELEQ